MQKQQFASRNTLYAIISAIETDLRDLVLEYVLQNPQVPDPYPPELRTKLFSRYNKYCSPKSGVVPDDLLLEYADFADTYELLRHQKRFLPTNIASELDAFHTQLEHITHVRNRVMHSRPIEPEDFPTTYDFATSMVSKSVLEWNALREMMRRLEDNPSFVLTLPLPENPWETIAAVPHNLPLPEFDDTGFIGRVQECVHLTKLILGHHQIITVLGEGGVGKTAILLKCLYDILDTASNRFDIIVWVSLKNQVLTAGGIKALGDSIKTTLGLFQAMADQLGALNKNTLTDVLRELRDYLCEFRVLLAVDNLETLQRPEEILDFLRDLPATTKVVITSRIGIGELEFRRPLLPMSDSEAVSLLRKSAQVHGVAQIAKISQGEAVELCRKLHFNPLAIRWVIAGIQQGTPLQEMISKKNDLLDFCVHNVYEKLGEGARMVLQIMLAARRPLGEAELAYLSDMKAMDARQQLFQLVATMMVRQEQKQLSDDSYETQYALSELSRQFLERRHKPPSIQITQIAKKLSKLSEAGEQAGMHRESDPYDHRAIHIRSANDRVPAMLLQRALIKSKAARSRGTPYDEAIELINQAKEVSPTYPEVYKIAAFIKVNSGDYVGAGDDYEQALQLAPNSPQILFFYAGFLARRLHDTLGALRLIAQAVRVAPDHIRVRAQHARILTYIGRVGEAWDIYENLLANMTCESPIFQIKTTNLAINCLHRMAEQQNDRREFKEAWETAMKGLRLAEGAIARWNGDRFFPVAMMDLLGDLTATVRSLRDNRNIAIIAENVVKYWRLFVRQKYFPSLLRKVLALCDCEGIDRTLVGKLRNIAEDLNIGTLKEHTGVVLVMIPERAFGFISCDGDSEQYYFNFGSIPREIALDELKVGSRFRFSVGKNHYGPCAVHLVPIDPQDE